MASTYPRGLVFLSPFATLHLNHAACKRIAVKKALLVLLIPLNAPIVQLTEADECLREDRGNAVAAYVSLLRDLKMSLKTRGQDDDIQKIDDEIARVQTPDA